MTKEQAIFYLKRVRKEYPTDVDHVAMAKHNYTYEERQIVTADAAKNTEIVTAIDMAIEALEK